MAIQGDLFAAADTLQPVQIPGELPLLRHQLLSWQERLLAHQGPLFAGEAAPSSGQGLLFEPGPGNATHLASSFSPLGLQPQALSFWRWPQAPQQGAALYFVIDRPDSGPATAYPAPALLLYVGETAKADQRWKGEHDCKSYLAAYQEALQKADLRCQLSIRFWLDVPVAIKPRRCLEQALIQRWLPPFNKETRGRWSTPFTAETKTGT
ncbi:GIY-YIG nuclease family protein [Cyanobium sp. HWJ4-Hawea]|uniref:GIY-YIG nuclease family protein n=1 Tax=Cyanobium sp. HWJ4-Hawea TaxID=2823713 RepID=UPI0020CF00AF|nr:GIY-YIG nuclease family protein [Cyanobium sp. HWJ4-Hawea]MCP9808002.1 GIY-YIG nuclease family protein [Cyanobium sp. HWJ4-Hawea]